VRVYQLMRRRPGLTFGLVTLITLFGLALGADILRGVGFIEDYATAHTGAGYAPPFTCATDNAPGKPQYCFLFGADKSGRDLFSRVIYGTRVSLSVAVIGALTSLIFGTTYGMIAGYFGGHVDNVLMRVIDFLLGLPGLIVIILLQVFFKALDDYRDQVGGFGAAFVELNRRMGGLLFIYIVIGLLSWIGMARLARGLTLALKQREYVEAARAIGARHTRIIVVHILPNLIAPLIIAEMLAIPGYIFTEASLSFLGLGVSPPTPSWGDMIIRAQREGFISRPYLVLAPALMLALTSLVGDGLRDWLDPRRNGRR
jgi:ABC-type dipeptide/oligopeptide/nickel transport system permease subunit